MYRTWRLALLMILVLPWGILVEANTGVPVILDTVVTPTQIRPEANRATPHDPETGAVPPILYPEGPGCSPGETGCDIAPASPGMLRDEAEGVNTLEATFWEGVTFLSPLWAGYKVFSGQGLWELADTQDESGQYSLRSLSEESFVGEDVRSVVDRWLRNTTLYSLFNKQQIPGDAIIKSAPGLFPLGHQYDLRLDVENTMKDSLDALPQDASTGERLRWIPSHKYLIVALDEGGWVNDLARPLWSDSLDRALRLKLDYMRVLQRPNVQMRDLLRGKVDWNRLGSYRYHQPTSPFLYSYVSGRNYANNGAKVSPVDECLRRGGRMPTLQDMVMVAFNPETQKDFATMSRTFGREANILGVPTTYDAQAFITSDMIYRQGEGVEVVGLTFYRGDNQYSTVAFEIDHNVGNIPFPNELSNRAGLRSDPFGVMDHDIYAFCIYD